MQRNLSLDLIKLSATIMVVALHLRVAWQFSGYAFLRPISALCGIAIPLFFMVSGYLMAAREVTWKYVRRKVFNIIKLTAVICLLYDVYLYIRTGSFPFCFPKCFIQKGDWWHFWYFGTMMIIYSVLPMIQRVLQGKILVWSLVGLFVVCVGFWISDICVQFERNNIVQTFRLWYFLFYFLLGYYLRRSKLTISVHWLCIIIFATAYLASAMLIPTGGVEYNFGSPLCMAYAFVFFMFVLGKDVHSGLVAKLSIAVLPTYVVHVLVIKKMDMGWLHPTLCGLPVPSILLFFFELVMTVIVCYILSSVIWRIPKIELVFKL